MIEDIPITTGTLDVPPSHTLDDGLELNYNTQSQEPETLRQQKHNISAPSLQLHFTQTLDVVDKLEKNSQQVEEKEYVEEGEEVDWEEEDEAVDTMHSLLSPLSC